MKNAKYIEPDDYFPIEIRKKFKLGEYAEESDSLKEHQESGIKDEIPNDKPV